MRLAPAADLIQTTLDHVRVGGEHRRGCGFIESLRRRDAFLEPFARDSRPPAQVLYQSVHETGAKQRRPISGSGRQDLGALREGICLLQFTPQAKGEPERVEAQAAQRMLRHMLEQRLRVLEGALGFVRSGAKHLYRRRSPQRGERHLEIDARVALLGQLEKRHCTFREPQGLRGAEVQQSRLRGFRVVAQCRHGFVAKLEMGRELGRAHIESLSALALE